MSLIGKNQANKAWPGLVLTGNVVTEIKAKSEKLLLGLKYDRMFERKNVDYLL